MSSPLLNFALENALVNYVSGSLTATGISNVNYYNGIQFSGVRQLPCVIVHCSDARRPFPNANLYQANVSFDFITQVDASNSYTFHNTGVAALRDSLVDYALRAALNPPASGIDSRIEPSLFVYGVVEQDQKPYLIGDDSRSVGQQFTLRFDCSN